MQRVIPPYPSTDRFSLPKTPDPPHLLEEPDDLRDAKALAHAYRGAAESRFKKKCWTLVRGDITKSKHYPRLIKAAALFREHGIAPASWCAWSMDFWKYYIDREGEKTKGAGRMPPLSLVFSEKFITERRGHFGRDGLNYLGGTVVFPKYWTEVMHRYNGMLWAFRMKQPTTELQIGHIVEDWFPGGWQYHYRRVRDEAQLDRARLQRMLMRGKWLWA